MAPAAPPEVVASAKKQLLEKRAKSPPKTREVMMLAVLLSIVVYRLIDFPTTAALLYSLVSGILHLDSDIVQTINFQGEVEGPFTHRFMNVGRTYLSNSPVNVTYHYVECGNQDAEPILFFHGLGETWKVWKDVMAPFCDKYRPIAFDSEGMGQSTWPTFEQDIPHEDLRAFYGDIQMQAIRQLGIRRYNIVNFDYSFWSTLPLLHQYGDHAVIRYAKFQSTAGAEDADRVPQGYLFKYAPSFMDWLFNSNPYSLVRQLFGKALVTWPGLVKNRRMYDPTKLSDERFRDVLLTEVAPNCFKVWVWGYHYGLLMAPQIELQRNIFEAATYPVYMMQGMEDRGQPVSLFDGTMKTEIVEAPVGTGLKEYIKRLNVTHKVVTEYAADGVTKIGPTASEFFPNSPWVKFKFVPNVGHFLHMEAEEDCIAAIRELLSADDAHSEALSWYY